MKKSIPILSSAKSLSSESISSESKRARGREIEKMRAILINGLHAVKLEDAMDLFSDMVEPCPFSSIIEFNKLLSGIAKMTKCDPYYCRSDHGRLVLSCSMDKTVWLCDIAHNDYVTCVQFNPLDEDYFISGSLDAKIRIWNT
ncbi:hypothetical protein AALP_AA2G014100 [Arabis alpina]|uniref:Uncharacterized protein n=1 Tax=Arabis alpina TaxID=50452 RepID=A0A087HEM3_ARAAL|nr:hypothetical protein AALP_AA2G014100 [Arabis alpina]